MGTLLLGEYQEQVRIDIFDIDNYYQYMKSNLPMGQTHSKSLCRLLSGRFNSVIRHYRSTDFAVSLPRVQASFEIDYLGTKWVLCRTDSPDSASLGRESEPLLGQLVWAHSLGSEIEALFQLDPTLMTPLQEPRTLLLRSSRDPKSGKRRLFTRECTGEQVTVEWLIEYSRVEGC